MRGGTAGTGWSWLPAVVCVELRWLPDCGDSVAAVTGRVAGSTAVPLREPGVDWTRDGLMHRCKKRSRKNKKR